MSESPTLGALWRRGEIRRADLDAVVDAYLADPAASRLPLAGRYVVDVAAALTARPISRRALADKKAEDGVRAIAVFNAIVQAAAEPGNP